ncbi:MAG TPA: UDP-glucose/GDP-mannose dehydrogenase family protein [Streptomyces sp.]
MKMTVVGCGYLGATHAACMAELGHEVLGLDTDADKVRTLNTGKAPFHERGLDILLARHTASGRLRFTTSYPETAAFGDLHFIGVGTPQRPDNHAYDLSHLFDAVRTLAPHLTRPSVIAVKSTVPVGTAPRVAELLHAHSPAGTETDLAWNPEFLRESFAVEDTLHPDRLVLGVDTPGSRAETVLREAFAKLIDAGTPTIVTDWATAELAKGSANVFLATKISFINAMAGVCEKAGANIGDLTDILGHDDRIGRHGMRSGLGFGGGCLPKDLGGFITRADELGAQDAVALLRETAAVNAHRRQHVVDLALEELGPDLRGKRIGVWGASFKPDTDDIRDSPALAVASALRKLDAGVTVTDPRALDNARKLYPELDYSDDPVATAETCDLLLHLTEWTAYTRIDPHRLNACTLTPKLIDARGTLNTRHWQAAGWHTRTLGHA